MRNYSAIKETKKVHEIFPFLFIISFLRHELREIAVFIALSSDSVKTNRKNAWKKKEIRSKRDCRWRRLHNVYSGSNILFMRDTIVMSERRRHYSFDYLTLLLRCGLSRSFSFIFPPPLFFLSNCLDVRITRDFD